jgi:5'(3')-deoxyribonucleotidase
MADRILVDVDEVIGDWLTPCLDIAEKVSGRRLNPADFDHWDIIEKMNEGEARAVLHAMAQPGFAYYLKPHKGAQDFIAQLKTLGDVRILTAQHFSSPTWTYDRNRWLWELFGIEPGHVTYTHEKYAHHGRVLIDDKPEHIVNWRAKWPAELPILWHIPNTASFQYDGLRAHTWEQVLVAVEEHLRGDV